MNLKEPKTMQPYEFWGYQLASVNYRAGDVYHCDGAECGKTRELGVLLLWSCATLHNLELLDVHGQPMRRVNSLVGAPLQGHLSDLIYFIEEEIELNPHLQAMCGKKWHEKAPYHRMTFTHRDGRAIIDFRPGGLAGAAFRGVHVNALAILDEATLLKNQRHYTEFKRALEPTATQRMYSVPDGDRECEFYRRCNNAVPYDELHNRWDGKGRPPPVLFRWAKTMQPPPFWTEERRREYIKDYGGEDSFGYVSNVLGQWGDPQNSVFPFGTLGPCLTDIPEYRRLKVIASKESGEITFELVSFEPLNGSKDGREVLLWERSESMHDWSDASVCRGVIERIVFEAFGGMARGKHWFGADLGQTKDPTEIIGMVERGTSLRMHTRLHIRGLDYHHQCEFIRALDMLADPDARHPIWGCDEGNAGTVVLGILARDGFEDRDFGERIMGIQFGSAFDAVDLDGEQIMDERLDKPRRGNGKELGTDLMLQMMQKKLVQYPLDPELLTQFVSHTATQGQRWRVFSKVADHLIDANRTLMINRVLSGSYGSAFDAFACGSHQR